MNNAKIWMLLTGIIVIVSGFFIYSIVKSKETEKASFMVKIQELSGKIGQLEKVKDEIEAVKKEKAEVEARYQEEISALEQSVADAKKADNATKAKVETLMREKDSLTKYIENNNAIIAKLNKKIEALEKERESVVESARRADEESETPVFEDPMLLDPSQPEPQKRQPMGARLAEDEIVDLGRIIVHPSTNEAARVEHVNTLYGFIVLSAGTNDGLKKDSVVNITRNNRLVAKAVVKKARENAASAVTLPEWTREEIRVGDLISINAPTPLPQR